MNKKIKINDVVVYSPSLKPVVGKVNGIMGNYITVMSESGEVFTKPAEDFCVITEEDYNRLKRMKGEQDGN